MIEASIVLLRFDAMGAPSPRSLELYRRVQAMAEPGADAQTNPMLKTLAALCAAEYQLRRGETAAATARIDAILRSLEARPATPALKVLLAVGKTLKGIAVLKAGGPTAALPWLAQGRDEMADLNGPQHPLTMMYAANRALALAALGRYKEAVAVLDEVEPALRQAMGPSAPNYRRIAQWRERIQQAARGGEPFAINDDFLT